MVHPQPKFAQIYYCPLPGSSPSRFARYKTTTRYIKIFHSNNTTGIRRRIEDTTGIECPIESSEVKLLVDNRFDITVRDAIFIRATLHGKIDREIADVGAVRGDQELHCLAFGAPQTRLRKAGASGDSLQNQWKVYLICSRPIVPC